MMALLATRQLATWNREIDHFRDALIERCQYKDFMYTYHDMLAVDRLVKRVDQATGRGAA